MPSTVLLDRAGPVATVTLNRPEKYNALNDAMMRDLLAVLTEVEGDGSLRAVVLRGAGKAFMAGGDVAYFHANLDGLSRRFQAEAAMFHDAIRSLRRMPKPVIAAVHGTVAGGGLSVMLACDLGIAAEGTQFTLAYANIGTSPDGGSTHFLPRIVGARRALELAFLPDRIDAARAEQIGLVNRVVPADAFEKAVGEVARRLASGPTLAFARTKALINATWDRPLDRQLDEEIAAFAACTTTADFADGVTAFVEKRAPRFEGR